MNGGFFVLSPEVARYLEDDETVWEQEPMRALAREGELACYRHEGFWHTMDTLRERHELEELWQSGAPWRTGRGGSDVDPGFWRDRRVLVTGHTGFKGVWLTLWLQLLGARVSGFSGPPPSVPSLHALARAGEDVESFEGDVRDARGARAGSRRRPPRSDRAHGRAGARAPLLRGSARDV